MTNGDGTVEPKAYRPLPDQWPDTDTAAQRVNPGFWFVAGIVFGVMCGALALLLWLIL